MEDLYSKYQCHSCNPWSQANLNRQIPKTAEPRISRITRIWKICIPNISAIRIIRGHAPRDSGFAALQIPMPNSQANLKVDAFSAKGAVSCLAWGIAP